MEHLYMDSYRSLLNEIWIQLNNINPLRTNPIKWSNSLKQFVGNNCLSVIDHFVWLVLKGLRFTVLFSERKIH